MKTAWWEKVLVAILVSVIYFAATVALIVICCFYFSGRPDVLFWRREFWLVVGGLGALSALVGPPVHAWQRTRGRGNLHEVRSASNKLVAELGREEPRTHLEPGRFA